MGYVTGPIAGLKPNPLAGTGLDPLDNGVGTQLADFKPLTSRALTGPLAQARSVGSVPVVGRRWGRWGADDGREPRLLRTGGAPALCCFGASGNPAEVSDENADDILLDDMQDSIVADVQASEVG